MSKRWAELERHTADALGGRRVIIDCKAYKRFSHHSLIENCRAKYCGPNDVPAIVSKHEGQRGAFITLPLDFVGKLLTAAMPQGSNYES